MKRALLALLAVLAFAGPARAQTAFLPALTAPSAGQAIQGVVAILGTTAVDGFVSAELSFAYSGDPTGTWFLVAQTNMPVFEDVLASWDTTTLTDGDYVLRLRVYVADGTSTEIVVDGLRIRNYTPMETPTPAPTVVQPAQAPTATPTATPYPTPTALPRNPAEIGPGDLSGSVGLGALAGLVFLVLLGIYLWLRRK
jgi:hypothetical protein